MFHPVGSQSPNVYWRRRLLFIGSAVIVLVLLAVTVKAISADGSGSPRGVKATRPVAAGSTPRTSTHPSRSTHTSRSHPSTSGTKSTGTVSIEKCRSSELSVEAVVGQDTYHVGAKPVVELQVTNVGSAPCVQDLADKQIVLKVYNGVSRVWGSHDCEIQPGTDKHTLAVGAPVRVSISWSGETSQAGCTGTRQQVGAGTYTLYATLSGKTGKAAQFTIN